VRPFAWSILLHLLVLAALAPMLAPAGLEIPPERVLQGRLIAAPVQQAPAVQPEVRREIPPVPQQVSAPSVQPHPRAAETVPAATLAVSSAPTFEVAPASPALGGGIADLRAEAVPANVAVVRERVEAGPDAAGLRQYRMSLAGEARRHKRFPEAARRTGLAGTVEVRIKVTAFDREAELTRSSGHALLDKAALEMLRLAAARAPLPEALRGQQFTVLLPVVFEVEDD
jgi:protein TonB